MKHTPHELAEDFPEFVEKIHKLRETDNHFVKMSDAYHQLNREVHRAETDVAPTSDDNLATMRKERIVLKDQIFAYLKA